MKLRFPVFTPTAAMAILGFALSANGQTPNAAPAAQPESAPEKPKLVLTQTTPIKPLNTPKPASATAPAKASAPVAKTTPPPALTTTAKPVSKATKTATAASKDAKKTEPEKEPVIPGMTIVRPKGGFLGLEVGPDNNFKLSFYDAKKKPAKLDVGFATARWPVKYQPNDERVVMNPVGDNALSGARFVRPPRQYRVYLSLFVNGNDKAVEDHIVEFSQ